MARGKTNRTGRSEKLAPFTPMLHHVMDHPTFQSLTPLAECLYWRLVRRAGYKGARNGAVFYSVREAAAEFVLHKDTIRAAFYLLQARGFIIAMQIGSIGVEGEGRATTWRLTDLPTPTNPTPTREYRLWQPGQDFAVLKGRPPLHARKPVLKNRVPCPKKPDEAPPVTRQIDTPCPKKPDVEEVIEVGPVLRNRTPKELPGGRDRSVADDAA